MVRLFGWTNCQFHVMNKMRREKTSNREVILLSIFFYWWGLGTHNNDGNVSKLVPARLNNDIRSSLTTSSTLPAFSTPATSSSDTSCSATTHRCCWHLYIRTGRAVVLLLVDGWLGCCSNTGSSSSWLATGSSTPDELPPTGANEESLEHWKYEQLH